MPRLKAVLELINENPHYRLLEKEIREGGETRASVLQSAKPYLIAALAEALNLPVFIITAKPSAAKELAEELHYWLGDDGVQLLPEPDLLPYQQAVSDKRTESELLKVLSILTGREKTGKPAVTVASVQAASQKLVSGIEFRRAWNSFKVNDSTDIYEIISNLQKAGYRLRAASEMKGEVSHRGDILDIFPANAENPVRLEFFGNTIESIRVYDPATQRSIKTVESVSVGPASEFLPLYSLSEEELKNTIDSIDISSVKREMKHTFEKDLELLLQRIEPELARSFLPLFNKSCISSYLSENTLIIYDESELIEKQAEFLHEEAEKIKSFKLEKKELPERLPPPYFRYEELTSQLSKLHSFKMASWGKGIDSANQIFKQEENYTGRVDAFIGDVKELLRSGARVMVTSYQAERLAELFGTQNVSAGIKSEVKGKINAGELTLLQGSLSHGWKMPGGVHLFTDSEIFGYVKKQRFAKKRTTAQAKPAVGFKQGSFVVHVDHGLAKFGGIRVMQAEGKEREYLILEYAAGDKLYVPLEQIDRVSRYIGAGDHAPSPSRLGSTEWAKIKKKAEESVEIIAKDLLELYASREVVKGYAYAPDTVWQREMESSFPYVETPDQLHAQKAIKEDMEKEEPMDRLILGDVGYGKTEVAIRAAFKAVMDGKQVAVLVPTTILAQQHLKTFEERLSAFPVTIDMLSRLRSNAEQGKIVEKMVEGGLDIVIGTHRLLQKDISFKKLGLVVIDEEQRFGVNHKERLKKMRKEVDVLTLSATPIPRTLHMSLVGVRDMSVMETPPEDRLPIKTYLSAYDNELIREAVLREIEREGQVFFVHNRVQSIEYTAQKLREIIPEANISVAHGQMAEGALESVMQDFSSGAVDVLVCTTIIESGVDVPNANTLIVHRAENFGLTQLYQLRGRVGRGANLAYAYFLYERGKKLTPEAEKRLITIFEVTELGAGYNIAMKDLEIRGAGNLLGVKQSGNINAVGFTLYNQMLAQAVEEQKALHKGLAIEKVKGKKLPAPSVSLPFDASIPASYVADEVTRLSYYKQLAEVENVEQIADYSLEFKDRFGKIPEELSNLLYTVKVRILAREAGVENITARKGLIKIYLLDGMFFNRAKLSTFNTSGVNIGRNQLSINTHQLDTGWQKLLEQILTESIK